jgi:thiol:disulfide interchange protein
MTKKSPRAKQNFAQWLVLLGVIILVGVVFLLKLQKNAPAQTQASGSQTAEVQLMGALEVGQPTFGFFHSDNCDSCLQMMEVVAEVYPEYAEDVVLVDVNVYDPANQDLLRQSQIRVIPTMIFFDPRGETQTVLGVIQPDQLRAQLNAITGE